MGFRLVVTDLDRATEFYSQLGFETGLQLAIASHEITLLGLRGGGRRRSLTLGPSWLDLDCFDEAGRPYPRNADAASLSFQHFALVTSDVNTSWRHACHAGATPISRDGPVKLPPSAGAVTAIKFRDPDGHPLELLQFPDNAAKGWPGTGMLGIDHSAISVADLAISRAFYQTSGLSVGKTTLNEGPTQTALDGLDGVQVDVMPMQPRTGPSHLELLHYRHPMGRSFGHSATNDIAATRIVWRAAKAALLRDPDGHFHQLAAIGA